MGLEMCETHLNLLSLIARFEKGFCLHLSARHIAGVLMQIARDLSRRRLGTALHLQRTDIAVELGGTIAKRIAVVHRSSGVQQLVIWAEVRSEEHTSELQS